MRIGLLSDTHSFLDPKIISTYFSEVDQIWHAGDIGDLQVAQKLQSHRPLVAVSGNIDDNTPTGRSFPSEVFAEVAGLRIYMIHIGGYPGRYAVGLQNALKLHRPDLFICGHSHILRIMPDPKNKLLHINPGACGREGFHKMRTAVRFRIANAKITDLEVIELGLRGSLA